MGKKPKNNSKVTTKAVKTQTSDPPSLKISGTLNFLGFLSFNIDSIYIELCLEEFEKSLASVVKFCLFQQRVYIALLA